MFVVRTESRWNMVLKTMKYAMVIKYRRALGCGRYPCDILSYFYQKVGPCWRGDVSWVSTGLGGVWRLEVLEQSWELRWGVLQFQLVIVSGRRDFLWLFFLKLVCSSWRIWGLVLLKFFVVCVSRKSFLNKSWEYGRLSCASIAEVLELLLWVVLMYAWKEGGEILGWSRSRVSA